MIHFEHDEFYFLKVAKTLIAKMWLMNKKEKNKNMLEGGLSIIKPSTELIFDFTMVTILLEIGFIYRQIGKKIG